MTSKRMSKAERQAWIDRKRLAAADSASYAHELRIHDIESQVRTGSGNPYADDLHVETCRGKTCNVQGKRSNMVAASVVHRQPNRRGWYCQSCARFLADPVGEIRRRRGLTARPGISIEE